MTVAMAIAAHDAGAEIRRGSTVERIIVRDDQVVGVVADGTEIPATVVVSAVDPKTTFLRLMTAEDLTPDFLMKIRNYRARGTLAKVNLALTALPRFRCSLRARPRSCQVESILDRRSTTSSARSTTRSMARCQPTRGSM